MIMVPSRPTTPFNHVKWAFSQTQTKSNAAWLGQTNSTKGFSVLNIKQEQEKSPKTFIISKYKTVYYIIYS